MRGNTIVYDFLSGRLSGRDRRRFVKLMRDSKDVRELSHWHEAIYRQIDSLSAEELQQLMKLLEAETNTPLISIRKTYLKYAAVFIGLLGGYFAYTYFQVGQQAQQQESVASIRTVKLEDGSTVELEGDSYIETIRFDRDIREVSLVGTATFSVKPSQRPFTVCTSDGYAASALGTVFKVQSLDNLYEVTVDKGRVAVLHSEVNIGILQRGDFLKVENGKTSLLSSVVPLVFDGTPLKEVIATVNEAYDANITLANTINAQITSKVTFERHLSITDIVEILCEIYHFSYSLESNQIIIEPK